MENDYVKSWDQNKWGAHKTSNMQEYAPEQPVPQEDATLSNCQLAQIWPLYFTSRLFICSSVVQVTCCVCFSHTSFIPDRDNTHPLMVTNGCYDNCWHGISCRQKQALPALPCSLPVEGIKHLYDDKNRESHGHGMRAVKDFTIHPFKHFILGQTLGVVGLWWGDRGR